MKYLWILSASVSLFVGVWAEQVMAECRVLTTDPTYVAGQLVQDTCETDGRRTGMSSGGIVRLTQILGTGGVPSTATDTTTTPVALPTGKKTFTGRVTCTGTCVQTQKIYGTWRSTADASLDDLVCTITLSKATADQASCIPTETNFKYWYVVTTLTSGTTPLHGVFAQY